MQRIREELLKQKDELEVIMKSAEQFLMTAPEGNLRISKNQNTTQYYVITESGDTHGKYISKSKNNLIQTLAQKDYERKVLRMATKRKVELERALNCINDDELIKLYQSLSEPRRKLIHPYELTDKEYAASWNKEQMAIIQNHQKKNPNYKTLSEDEGFTTERGEIVRSKSEKILADKFLALGIPYFYEIPLFLNGYGYISPDFKLLNIRTRHTIYWEHLGMMDIEDYVNKSIKKIESFERNHLFPGRDLILTYETKDHPLNIKTMTELINEYLR